MNTEWSRLYADLGLDLGEAEADPNRRRIDGTVLEAAGVSGIATGGSSIFFERTVVIVIIGSFSHRILVPYESMRSIQFTGRGALINTSGGGWMGGGFGLSGALQGALMASVMNRLTTTVETSVESIVSLAWSSGHMVVLNQKFLPMQLADFLSPIVDRIREAATGLGPHSGKPEPIPAPSGIAADLMKLAELHKSGIMTDDEFASAKARVLQRDLS
jgi:hypothetical protein